MADLVTRLDEWIDGGTDAPWWWDVESRGGPAAILREAKAEILRLTDLLANGHGLTSTEEEACPRCRGVGTTEAGELSGLPDYPCTFCNKTGRRMTTRCVSCDSVLKTETT